MSQKNCSHKWERALISGLPAYWCKYCGATQFEAVRDATLTERELRDPMNSIRAVPDFGAPCLSYNLAKKIQEGLKKRVRTEPPDSRRRRR